MVITLIILVLSAAFFMSGKVRSDLVALCALISLLIFQILTPEEALSGFSNSVVIMMVGLFVVGGAIFQTGLAKMISSKILKLAGKSELRLFLLVMFGGDILAGFFTTDVAVIQKGYAYLKGFALETIVTAILFSMVGYFNGNNKTVWVMTQGLIQTLLVRLPFAYVMSIQPNASLTKIGLAAPVSTMVGIVLNVGFYIYLDRAEKKSNAL